MTKKLKVFFDSEFTGLFKSTKLISLGAITEHNETFYAEFIDYPQKVNKWIRENVIANLQFNNKDPFLAIDPDGNTEMKGDSAKISKVFQEWLEMLIESHNVEQIEFWSDCLAYDWVLLNDLWGGALNAPNFVYYIPFDICTLLNEKGFDPDISREKFAGMTEGNVKHNALWDAKVIKKCHHELTEGMKF